jgi:hypothetical protein
LQGGVAKVTSPITGVVMKADVILRLETRSEPVVEEIAYVHAVILGRSGLEEFNKLEQTDWVRYTIQTVEVQE